MFFNPTKEPSTDTTWMNPKNAMLIERLNMKGHTSCDSIYVEISRIDKSIETENRLIGGCQGLNGE